MVNFNESIEFKNRNIDVFAIGELLVDMISDDYDISCNSYSKFLDGSPANIVMNIKRLGGNPIISASVGNDNLGKFLINNLEKNNINTNYINEVNYSTSLVLVTKSKDTPLPIFYRNADYNLKYNSKIDSVLKNSKFIHFSCWPISQSNSRLIIENENNENTIYSI